MAFAAAQRLTRPSAPSIDSGPSGRRARRAEKCTLPAGRTGRCEKQNQGPPAMTEANHSTLGSYGALIGILGLALSLVELNPRLFRYDPQRGMYKSV